MPRTYSFAHDPLAHIEVYQYCPVVLDSKRCRKVEGYESLSAT